jgi:hypothetical protein
MLFDTSTESVTSVKVIVPLLPFITVSVAGVNTASLTVVVKQGSIMVTVKLTVSVSVKD